MEGQAAEGRRVGMGSMMGGEHVSGKTDCWKEESEDG